MKWVDNFIQKQLSPQFMSQEIPFTELVKPTDITKTLTWNHMNSLFQLAHDKLILFYDSKDKDSKHVIFSLGLKLNFSLGKNHFQEDRQKSLGAALAPFACWGIRRE